jgi:hypothetical protein
MASPTGEVTKVTQRSILSIYIYIYELFLKNLVERVVTFVTAMNNNTHVAWGRSTGMDRLG